MVEVRTPRDPIPQTQGRMNVNDELIYVLQELTVRHAAILLPVPLRLDQLGMFAAQPAHRRARPELPVQQRHLAVALHPVKTRGVPGMIRPRNVNARNVRVGGQLVKPVVHAVTRADKSAPARSGRTGLQHAHALLERPGTEFVVHREGRTARPPRILRRGHALQDAAGRTLAVPARTPFDVLAHEQRKPLGGHVQLAEQGVGILRPLRPAMTLICVHQILGNADEHAQRARKAYKTAAGAAHNADRTADVPRLFDAKIIADPCVLIVRQRPRIAP